MTDYTATPLISEEAEPLNKLIGNEYELGWRSVWIHTKLCGLNTAIADLF